MKFQELLAKTNLRRGELKPSFNTGETPTQQHFHSIIDGLYLAQDDTLYKDKHSGLGIVAATPTSQDTSESITQNVLLFYDDTDQEPAWAMSILEGFHLKNASDQAQLSVLTDGKVGIGTTTPATQLDVKGDLTLGADYQGDGRAGVINFRRGANNVPTASMGFTGDVSEFQFQNGFGGGHYTFYTDVSGTFTEKMRIANDGNVGIGTSNPERLLELYSENSVAPLRLTSNRTNGGDAYIEFKNKSSAHVGTRINLGHWNTSQGLFRVALGDGTAEPTTKLDLHSSGDANFFGTVRTNGSILTSDLRYKKNVQSIIPETVNKLNQLRGSSFEWRTDEFSDKGFSEGTKLGFIAQELKEVYPELVDESNEGYLSVNYNGLIPILVEAIKDLNQQNQALQESVENLKQRIPNTSQA